MVANGWTEKVEQLERENAELKATVNLLTTKHMELSRIINNIREIMLEPDEDVEYPDLRTLTKIEKALNK